MIIRIVFALLFLIAVPIRAVSFPQAAFQSTSPYNNVSLHSSNSGPTTYDRPCGSFSAISAANFDALNSEEEASYAAPRKGRPGDGAIGEYDFESPVGDTPWLLMTILLLLTYLHRKKELQKEQKLPEE